MAACNKMAVFWVIVPCDLVKVLPDYTVQESKTNLMW
jgi:hypothetical protein